MTGTGPPLAWPTTRTPAAKQSSDWARSRGTDVLGLATGQTLGGSLHTSTAINPRTVRAATFVVGAGAGP